MHSYQPKLSSPSHSEWGLINGLKQKQYEDALKMQKVIEYQKKQAFRNELENQLRMKQYGDMREKSQDKAYHDYIVSKTKNEENRSQQEKYQKYLTRKQMDENNLRKEMQQRQATFNSRIKANESTGQDKYLIGFRDENSIKATEQMKKQVMLTEMQQQLRGRQHLKRQQRMNEIQDFQKSIQEQEQLSKSLHNGKQKFRQNQKVFQYYNSLYQQKQDQKNQLEYSFVDKPLMSKIQSQDMINKRKSYEELMRKQQIKDTLDQQMDQHRVKQMIERHVRPEEVSYSFFGTMFDQASKGYGQYDKKSYNEYLQRQMAEQRENKRKFEFMDQREYLYNINQINKAVNGTYLNETYQDCSIANVGEKLKIDPRPLHGLMGQHGRPSIIDNPQVLAEKQSNDLDGDKKLVRENLQSLLKKNTSSRAQSLSQKQSSYLQRKGIHG